MKLSKETTSQAKQLFRVCFTGGQLDEAKVRQAVQALITRKPRHYLGILQMLHRLVRLELTRRSARIESAVALDPTIGKNIEDRLAQVYGPGLGVAYAVNEKLIGGLRIKVGSDVWDGSVSHRLEKLKQSL